MKLNVLSVRRGTMFAAVVMLAGCAALPGMQNLGAQRADNPLGGTDLAWSKDPDGVPFEGQKACSTWPIQNKLTVKATTDQICATGQIYHLVGVDFDGPKADSESLSVQSDGSGQSALMGAGMIKASGVQKIGTCSDNTRTTNVWVTSYDGCVPNKDPGGAPSLTASSTYLQVGDARWKFEPAAQAPAAPKPTAKN